MLRFAIHSQSEVEKYSLYWNHTTWRVAGPDRLMDQAEAEREMSRLQASLPHDRSLKIVDMIERREKAAHWNAGWMAISLAERRTEAAKRLRQEALDKANAAVSLN